MLERRLGDDGVGEPQWSSSTMFARWDRIGELSGSGLLPAPVALAIDLAIEGGLVGR
jgi:hypothetical protein